MREFQHIGSYMDHEKYDRMLANQALATAKAMIRALNAIVESIFLAPVPGCFVDNGMLHYIWGKNAQPGDDNNYKSAKEFFKANSKMLEFIKKATGDFQSRFKNHVMIVPEYGALYDGK